VYIFLEHLCLHGLVDEVWGASSGPGVMQCLFKLNCWSMQAVEFVHRSCQDPSPAHEQSGGEHRQSAKRTFDMLRRCNWRANVTRLSVCVAWRKTPGGWERCKGALAEKREVRECDADYVSLDHCQGREIALCA
jgi:hypothetical protein